jgi:hypothetical protein
VTWLQPEPFKKLSPARQRLPAGYKIPLKNLKKRLGKPEKGCTFAPANKFTELLLQIEVK